MAVVKATMERISINDSDILASGGKMEPRTGVVSVLVKEK
jgi:hypothetical protein